MRCDRDAHFDTDCRRPESADGSRLSLVIAAWNEEETIGQAVQEAVAALQAIVADYEIIVVDDGSTDRTAELVRAIAARNTRVRLVQHPSNLGYGAALRSGFEAATMELIAFTDADCQFYLNNLQYMLRLTREYDIACGYRIDRQDPVHRRFVSWGYNTLVTLLLGCRVRDVDCALKVFRREHLRTILPDACNFFANAEMLTKAQLKGLSIIDVGVRHRPRELGQSKVSWREVPRTLCALLPFWWSSVLFPAKGACATKLHIRFWLGLALLMAVSGCLLFPSLSYPLLEPDEGRYAEIAREMLTSGEWIVPTLYNEPYFDKPPMLYWLVAGTYKLCGTNIWASRLVPVSASFITVLVTYFFGARILGVRAAFLGASLLTLSVGFVHFGRVLILDGVLSLAVVASIFTAYEAIRGDRLNWTWWIASSIGCAAGVLTKGPVAFVLFAPPLMTFAWISRNPVRPTLKHWIAYVAVLICVAGPWYGAVMERNPGFAYYFFWRHHIIRFFGAEYHPRPFWFYVPVLLVAGMPWSLLLFPLGKFLFSRDWAVGLLRPRPVGYLLLWAAWCIFFFSLSSGKLPAYISPAFPAISLLLGFYLDQVLFGASSAEKFARPCSIALGRAMSLLCVGAIAANLASCLLSVPNRHEFSVGAAVWTICFLGIATVRRRIPSRAMWALCCLIAMAANFQSSHRIVQAWAKKFSPLSQFKPTVALLRSPDTALACYGREWGSVAFCHGRTDILNFSLRPRHELTEFLQQHVRTLVLVKSSANLDWFRTAIPPRMLMTPLGRMGDATAALVERAACDVGEAVDCPRRKETKAGEAAILGPQ